MKGHFMRYGRFDEANREYVIERADTPRPWSNYIGDSEFGGVITNNATGYSFYKSAAQGRLTRFRFNDLPSSNPGRFLYLRDAENGSFWTNSWQPTAVEQESYECRHGSGYTNITSSHAGIESSVTYFVPLGEKYEVWKVVVRNNSDKPRSLNLIPFVEPQTNWSASDDTINLQYTQYIVKTTYLDNAIDIGSNVNMPTDLDHFENKDQKRHTFFALSGANVDAYDGDLESFMGSYGTYAQPQALLAGGCTNSTASGDMPCAALQTNVTLQPGEETSFAVLFGVGEAAVAAVAARTAMNSVEKMDAALAGVKEHWHSRMNRLHAETPDENFNAMLNMWAPFNNLMTFYWSRTASLVYAGERDGLGFRDTVQDIVGSSMLVIEESRERLELMLTGQYSHGGAKPVVKPFAHNPGAEEFPDHYRSDDCMWFFNAVPAYVKETGNFDFYKKVLPYADAGEGSIFQHLRRAIEFNIERSGAHNLPCGLAADWNDCIRLGEKGETVFVAFQLRYAMNEYIDIAKRLGEEEEAAWATAALATLDADLNTHAWDGEWYLRAYRYDGLKFGSHENEEGKIFMNPQSWSVLSGHATGDRATQVMDSMHEHLSTDYGIMVSTPPYVKTDPQICLGRLMNPGMKENGGVFNHTQGWAIMAAAKLGMNDRAWEYLSHCMPASYNDKAEVRQVEPYVVCQSTHSRFSPRFGAGRLSWLSGSAVWNYVAMATSILGIQAEYEGLRIDPCIPSEWSGFTVTRQFRDKVFNITVRNDKGAGKGVTQLRINNQEVSGNLISADLFQDENTVEVTLG